MHNNLGTALAMQGDPAGAIAHFRQALELHPGFAQAHANLALALFSEGRYDESRDEVRGGGLTACALALSMAGCACGDTEPGTSSPPAPDVGATDAGIRPDGALAADRGAALEFRTHHRYELGKVARDRRS